MVCRVELIGMKKVFVTGATGFIGEKLCYALKERGYDVHAIIRGGVERGKHLKANGVQVFPGDLSERDKIREAMEGCQYVIHTAAYAAAWAKNDSYFFDVNVQGAVNVMEIARDLGVERVVHTSSAGTIGPANGDGPSNEETIRMVDFYNSYESSKFMSEERALQLVNEGMDIVIVLPTRVFGPGTLSKNNGFTLLMHKYLFKNWALIPGNGRRSGNYVYVDDVVEGLILALEKGGTGQKYILGGENASYNHFFTLVREVSGKKSTIVRMPLWMILIVARFETWRAKTFNAMPLLTSGWARKYHAEWSVEVEKARRDLGYDPRPLKDGIEKTVEWLKETYGKKNNN